MDNAHHTAKRIGVIGLGFVGSALVSNIKPGTEVLIYDKYKEIGCTQEYLQKNTDVIFLCLPTPMHNDGQDLTELNSVVYQLNEGEYMGIVVIKSTITSQNIQKLIGEYPKLTIVVNPEFLNQNDAHNDFKYQNCLVLGGHGHECRTIKEVYENSFELFNKEIPVEMCTHTEACDIKYMHNIYHAYKALFWNYVLETTGNHRKIFQAYRRIIDEIGNEMNGVGSDGKLGYGGACFPKDVRAMHSESPHKLTEFMITYNEELRFK